MTIQTMLILLGQGFLTTLSIFFLTLIGSLPLGLLVYFGKISRIAPLRWAVNAYISIMRGTPLMLQLMVVYFGPNLLFGITLPSNWRFIAVIIGFIINYAAYFAEIYRGGIESIPRGQYEAAEVLGYTKTQTFMKIILPQMFKHVMPSVTNEVITLVKDTSLAYVIGVVEMFTRAKQINAAPGGMGLWAFLAAGVIYYVFNFIVTVVMDQVEKKMSYYQ
ncbi:MAG: amino acid ABC transporter permease [Clostridia bacterium]|nr:amino acid ABC transporter permease [Clostridia bacterium]